MLYPITVRFAFCMTNLLFQNLILCVQGDVEKWSAEEKKVQQRLSKAVKDASTLQTERDAAVNEKRVRERSLRDLNRKANSLVGQIRDKEKEKRCLKTTRDNCIAMYVGVKLWNTTMCRC